jgi:hypothetical protein
MVAVAFTHRYSPPPQSLLPEAAADVRSAIDYVRANAASLQGDADRMGVIAWSSGGVSGGIEPRDFGGEARICCAERHSVKHGDEIQNGGSS